jgi:hypothetical protein
MLPVAQVDVARLTELVTNAWRRPARTRSSVTSTRPTHLSDADHGLAETTIGQPTSAQTSSFVRLENAKINGGAAVNGRS